MGFFRQEYWSGLPFPSPGDLPDSGIKPRSPALQADSLLMHHWGSYRMQQKQFYSILAGASILGLLASPSSSGFRFVRILHYDLSILGSPHGIAHNFIELCKPLHHKVVINIPFEKHNTKRLMYPNVHCGTIYNRDMEAT